MSAIAKYEYFNDTIIKKEYFEVNGVKEGVYTEYYSNGNIYIICNYVNGVIHGTYIENNKNGELYMYCNYINGVIDGEVKQFCNNTDIH